MNYVDKFNKTFQDFVGDLCIAFPNDSEFQMCKMLLAGALMVDNTMVIRFFHSKIGSRYGELIHNKNEGFFMDKNYEKYAERISGAEQVIEKVKGCWKSLDDTNKEVVWKYLRVLCALAKKNYDN